MYRTGRQIGGGKVAQCSSVDIRSKHWQSRLFGGTLHSLFVVSVQVWPVEEKELIIAPFSDSYLYSPVH